MKGKPEKKGYVLEGGATLNAGYFHEILDRSHLICSMVDDYLIEHPGMTVEMNKKCESAQQLLCEVANLACAEQDRIFGADLAKPSEWISVGTPPREGGYVLAVYKGKLPFICMFHSDLNVFAFNCEEVRPTHWQPLPSPPAKGTP